MALGLLQTLTIIKDVDGTNYAAAPLVRPTSNLLIDSVTALSATQIANAGGASGPYTGAVNAVNIRYFSNAQQLTGTLYVSNTLTNILTNSNGYLQSLHAVQLANGSPAAGSTGAGTVYLFPNNTMINISAATAKQIAQYPNALTQINTIYYVGNQQLTGTRIITEAVATVLAAS